MTTDTLKQAAQALRRAQHLYGANDPQAQEAVALAAALEAMVEQPTALFVWFDDDGHNEYIADWTRYSDVAADISKKRGTMPKLFYAAPIATPEHDAQVRNAALAQAAAVADKKSRIGILRSLEATHKADAAREIAASIRALKTTGGDHAA